MTAPVRFDKTDVTHWINVLHNAARVPRGDPDYEDAQAAINTALLQIQHLNRAANQTERAAADQPGAQVNPGATVIGGLAHGASLGLGEPIAGAISALRGKGFQEGAEAYREGLGNLEAPNPNLAASSEIAGMLALPGARAGRTAIGAGLAAPVGVTAGRIARGALAGAVPGAVAGFSAGGEDPGDIGARLRGAGTSAAAGAVLGGGLSALSGRHALRAAELADKEVRREANRLRLERLRSRQVSEPTLGPDDALRTELLRAGVLPENIDAQLARQRNPQAALNRPIRPMESPAFRRRAEELGQPQRAVPQGEVSGVGNPPVNPAVADAYVRGAQARQAGIPDTRRPFVEPRLTERTPKPEMPPLTLQRGGRYRQGFATRGVSRPLTPEQDQALQRLVADRLLAPGPVARSHRELVQMTRQGLRPKVDYWTRGGKLEQSLSPDPVASANPRLPTTEEIAQQQFAALQQAAESGDELAIRAMKALTGLGGFGPR